MKRRIGLVIATLLILIGIIILVKIGAEMLAPRGRGALQVTSNIKAHVFLDNKGVGQIPLSLADPNQTIPSGIHDLKIVPEDLTVQPFTAKITINSNVLTAVDRTFLPGAFASSYVLTLEKTNDKNPDVFISSIPDGAIVTLDGESQGVTPLEIKPLSQSEHEVEIEKPGFAKKTVRIRAVNYYKVILNTILGTEFSGDTTSTPAVSPSPAPSAQTTTTPTESAPKVVIGNTPTGFLRVRAEASAGSAEIGRVNPGESYPYVSENNSWYEITLSNGTRGWVSKTYSTKTP